MKKKNIFLSGIIVFLILFGLPASTYANQEDEEIKSRNNAIISENTKSTTTFDLGGGKKETVFFSKNVRY